jgi:hypothetical protein
MTLDQVNQIEITVNGQRLNVAQTMTVHVALQDFAMSLEPKNSLGADEHGRTMRASYLDNIKEINLLLQNLPSKEEPRDNPREDGLRCDGTVK